MVVNFDHAEVADAGRVENGYPTADLYGDRSVALLQYVIPYFANSGANYIVRLHYGAFGNSALEVLLSLATRPDWVLITSWNEWHEGSEIEPSVENGDRELKTTRQFAPKFTRLKPRTR